MSKEITMWSIMADIQESGDILSVIEGIENHPDVRFGLDNSQLGYKVIKDEFNLGLNFDSDEVDTLIDKIKNYKGGSIIGVKTSDSLISISLGGDFQEIAKNESGMLTIENFGFEDAKGYLCRILSKLNKDMVEITPHLKREKIIRDTVRKERIRRDNRLKNVPEMSPDFWQALHDLGNYADNFEEFKLLLSPAMDDISDRNFTRLGRASEILDEGLVDLYSNQDIEITVYRCLPVGEEIEAGDWVSTDYNYALSHSSNVKGEYEVVEASIPANEIICGADTCEMYYAPRDIWKDCESLVDVWKSVTHRKRMKYEPMERIVNKALKENGLDICKETELKM